MRRVPYTSAASADKEVSAMALLDEAIGGWSGGLVVGVGAALVGPAVLAVAGSVVKPIAKTLVRGALVVSDAVTHLAAETSEQVNDLVAEVRVESAKGSGSGKSRPTPIH
jgi:hypothetical protein